MIARARLFIGSSTEAIDAAEAVHSLLERRQIEPTVWTTGVFGLNSSGLESMLEACSAYDFACFILRKDDMMVSRGKRADVVRDNVILEIGLFLGALGRNRVFVVFERGNKPHLPSDLDGIHFLDYDARRSDGNLKAALTAPCVAMADKVHQVGLRRGERGPSGTFLVSPLDEQNTRWQNMTDRLERCRRGETVRFISITGKNFLLPYLEVGEDVTSRLGPRALSRGVRLKGIVLDPGGPEAEFRSEVESPHARPEQRLLLRDASDVTNLPARYRDTYSLDDDLLERLELRYSSVGLSFGLWLYSDIAFLEPFHFGKRRTVPHLCGFAQLAIPKGTEEYYLLERHFEVLWENAKKVPWSNGSAN